LIFFFLGFNLTKITRTTKITMNVPYLPNDIMDLILFERRASMAKDKLQYDIAKYRKLMMVQALSNYFNSMLEPYEGKETMFGTEQDYIECIAGDILWNGC